MAQGSQYSRRYEDILKMIKSEEERINNLIEALFSDMISNQDVKDATTRKTGTREIDTTIRKGLEEFVDSHMRDCASVLYTSHYTTRSRKCRTVIEGYIPASSDAAYATVRGKAKKYLLDNL
jgi:hypothetical protein